MALTVASPVSELSLAEDVIISASEQEPELGEDIQQAMEEPVQLSESSRRVVSVTEPEDEGNAQAVTLDVGLRVDSPPIEADELMADIINAIASTDSGERRADTGTALTIPYTASRSRGASRGRRRVTQESSGTSLASF